MPNKPELLGPLKSFANCNERGGRDKSCSHDFAAAHPRQQRRPVPKTLCVISSIKGSIGCTTPLSKEDETPFACQCVPTSGQQYTNIVTAHLCGSLILKEGWGSIAKAHLQIQIPVNNTFDDYQQSKTIKMFFDLSFSIFFNV